MMKGIVFSHVDMAGRNISEALLEKGFKETGEKFQDFPVYKLDDLVLASIKEDIIFPTRLDELAKEYQLELIVMASRHKSESGKPTLTVHPTGNFGEEAKYGGETRALQNTSANAMRNIYLQILNDPPEGYEVSLEATHHGPTEFETPILFAELGSSEEQWGDTEAGEFLADAIVNGLQSKEAVEAVIGFGGNHYASKFSKMEEDIAFGHICPKYAMDLLDEGMVRQMVEKTTDGIGQAVLDEKGMKGRQKSMVKMFLEAVGIEF